MRIGKVEVNDETDVRLIDAEAKRLGRHDHVELSAHEPLLNLFALLRLHLPVVSGRVHVLGAEPFVKFVGGPDRSYINDSAALGFIENAPDSFPFREAIHSPKHFQEQIRTLDAGIYNNRIFQTQLLNDVMLNFRRGRGRKRQNRRSAKLANPSLSAR